VPFYSSIGVATKLEDGEITEKFFKGGKNVEQVNES